MNKQTNWYRIRIFCDNRHRGDLPRTETRITKDIRMAYQLYAKGKIAFSKVWTIAINTARSCPLRVRRRYQRRVDRESTWSVPPFETTQLIRVHVVMLRKGTATKNNCTGVRGPANLPPFQLAASFARAAPFSVDSIGKTNWNKDPLLPSDDAVR